MEISKSKLLQQQDEPDNMNEKFLTKNSLLVSNYILKEYSPIKMFMLYACCESFFCLIILVCLAVLKGIFLFQECGFNRVHPGEAAASPIGQRIPGYMDYQGIGYRPQFPVERKWALGLQVKFLGFTLVLVCARLFALH